MVLEKDQKLKNYDDAKEAYKRKQGAQLLQHLCFVWLHILP